MNRYWRYVISLIDTDCLLEQVEDFTTPAATLFFQDVQPIMLRDKITCNHAIEDSNAAVLCLAQLHVFEVRNPREILRPLPPFLGIYRYAGGYKNA